MAREAWVDCVGHYFGAVGIACFGFDAPSVKIAFTGIIITMKPNSSLVRERSRLRRMIRANKKELESLFQKFLAAPVVDANVASLIEFRLDHICDVQKLLNATYGRDVDEGQILKQAAKRIDKRNEQRQNEDNQEA